jgi:hypothetical protein
MMLDAESVKFLVARETAFPLKRQQVRMLSDGLIGPPGNRRTLTVSRILVRASKDVPVLREGHTSAALDGLDEVSPGSFSGRRHPLLRGRGNSSIGAES